MNASYIVRCYVADIDDFAGRTITYLKVWHEKEFDDLTSANVYADFQRKCGGYDKVELNELQ